MATQSEEVRAEARDEIDVEHHLEQEKWTAGAERGMDVARQLL